MKAEKFIFNSQEREYDNLSDEQEEHGDRIFARKKSSPKTTAKAKRTTEMNQAVMVRGCSIVLEKFDETEEMRRITRSRKRKAETIVDSEENVSSESVIVPDDEPVQDAKRPKSTVPPKNTDKTITVKSKNCVICNKSCKFASSHYANFHEGMEVYSARMSVENSDKIRKTPPANAIRETQKKLSAHCPYCEKTVNFERNKWIEHISRHTGEYQRHCGKCNVAITSITEKSCSHLHSDYRCIPIVNTNQFTNTLYVYMCNFCNYTQSIEDNMKKHICNMHDININILNHYTKIILIPNFGKARTAQRFVSKCESETNSDVFKPTQQDDDVRSDSIREIMNGNYEAATIRPSITTSIADRLNERFKKQKESSSAVKQEHDESATVIYRDPAEIEAIKQSNEKPRLNLLLQGDAVEEMCKIEVGKTEASTSGMHGTEQDDTDDQNWESCSDDDETDESPSKSLSNINQWINTKGKGKPNKSRIRSKKRNDKSFLSSIICKKEKPDEIIDLDDEIKIEKKPPVKSIELRPILPDMKRVHNIALSECLGVEKYHCYIGDCDFLSIGNISSLSNHLRTKHTEAWTGYCHACDEQILNGNFSLKKEFDHLVAFHVPTSPTDAKLRAKVAELTKPPEEPPAESSTPPKIRIRRFSGDKLSGATESAPLTLVPSPSQPRFVIPLAPNPHVNFPPKGPIDQGLVPSAGVSENPLKPWTNSMNTKSTAAEMKLKRDCSLIALFKCMAIDCIFTTSDKEAMAQHLSNHEESATDSFNCHSSDPDDSSWLECCYCDEVLGSCKMLVDHIISEHGTSIFQCPYCFYRSVDRQNVNSHLKRYHSNEDAMHVFVCGSEIRSLSDDINAILLAQENVKEIQCPENGEIFLFICNLQLNTLI